MRVVVVLKKRSVEKSVGNCGVAKSVVMASPAEEGSVTPSPNISPGRGKLEFGTS